MCIANVEYRAILKGRASNKFYRNFEVKRLVFPQDNITSNSIGHCKGQPCKSKTE